MVRASPVCHKKKERHQNFATLKSYSKADQSKIKEGIALFLKFTMTKDKELKSMFIMLQDLKSQIKLLTDKVEALSEAQATPNNCNCSKDIEEIQVEITDLVDFQTKLPIQQL